MSASHSRPLAICICLLSFSGCATMDGSFVDVQMPCDGEFCVPEPFEQFERGKPNIVIDSVGWVFGIPNRIFLWNWYVENHNISLDTEQQLRQYIAVNGLHDTKVRLNQYDPGGEWRRLAENQRVGAGWRYTVGALSTLGYTIFPGRLIGTDYYNPFTNTVHVYSDVPAIGMQESAYASDVIGRDLPGTYAFSQLIPGVNLVHETITTRDVLDYVASSGDWDGREEAVHVLYPRYGGSVGGALDYWVSAPAGLFHIGGLLVGHATGRYETHSWESPNEMPLLGALDRDATPPEAATSTIAQTIASASSEETPTESLPAPAGPHMAAGIDMTDDAEPNPAESPDKPAGEVVTASYEEPAAGESSEDDTVQP